ncbi:MAG: response regulator, partial [Gammaproteobacteria bacterium]|nr:response regulator [Gammaproteobacteria bacterium]
MVESPVRVLVVDDQDDVVAALKLMLKGEGYVVSSCHRPAQALALSKNTDFDVALIDLNYTEDTTSG